VARCHWVSAALRSAISTYLTTTSLAPCQSLSNSLRAPTWSCTFPIFRSIGFLNLNGLMMNRKTVDTMISGCVPPGLKSEEGSWYHSIRLFLTSPSFTSLSLSSPSNLPPSFLIFNFNEYQNLCLLDSEGDPGELTCYYGSNKTHNCFYSYFTVLGSQYDLNGMTCLNATEPCCTLNMTLSTSIPSSSRVSSLYIVHRLFLSIPLPFSLTFSPPSPARPSLIVLSPNSIRLLCLGVDGMVRVSNNM